MSSTNDCLPRLIRLYVEGRFHQLSPASLSGKGSCQAAGAGDIGAAWSLDLDDLRAHIGQQPAGIGQGEHVAGIQNADAFQGQLGRLES